jgi:hypothetical protein
MTFGPPETPGTPRIKACEHVGDARQTAITSAKARSGKATR